MNKENKLIKKQIDKLNNKEKKIINKKENEFIKSKVDPIKNKLNDKIPQKLQSTLESAFEKGFYVVFEKGTTIIEKSYNKEQMNIDFDINNYALNKQVNKRNLKTIDKKANKKVLINKSLSAIEGGALGILGIGLPDIPIFIGVILKTIYEISLSYGFNYSHNKEKAYILNIICASVTKGSTKEKYLSIVDDIGNKINNNIDFSYNIDMLIKETSLNMTNFMITSKFIQGLPLVGVVGGITNFKTIQDVSKIAKIKYKKRYLSSIL